MISASHDISERMSMERALTESVERYRQALNSSLLGYALCEIVVDEAGEPADFVYREVNPAFEAFTGLGSGDVLGRRATDLFAADEIAELVRRYGRVALTGEPETFEYPMPSLAKWYEVAAFSPERGQFIAFFSDVTERRRAEEGLKAYADRLRTSNEELQRFAYVASHDLQEPLRSIVSFSQLLERRYKGRLDQDADDYIGFIVEGGNRMQTLIRDLLQLSRVETHGEAPRADGRERGGGRRGPLVRRDGRRGSARGSRSGRFRRSWWTRRSSSRSSRTWSATRSSTAARTRPPEIRISAEREGRLWQLCRARTTGSGSNPSTSTGSSRCSSGSTRRTSTRGRGSVSPSSRRSSSGTAAPSASSPTPGEGSTFSFTLPAA